MLLLVLNSQRAAALADQVQAEEMRRDQVVSQLRDLAQLTQVEGQNSPISDERPRQLGEDRLLQMQILELQEELRGRDLVGKFL